MKHKQFLKVNIKQFDEAISFEKVKEYLEANVNTDEVRNYLNDKVLTADNVKNYLTTSDGQRILQPIVDKQVDSWKNNNLEGLIEDEVKKRNPDKTPEQIEIEKLRGVIEGEKAARNREALVNKALKVAKEKDLPDSIVDFFIGKDEEATLENLTKLEEVYSKSVSSAVETKFKESGRIIDQGGSKSQQTIDIASLAQEASIRQ